MKKNAYMKAAIVAGLILLAAAVVFGLYALKPKTVRRRPTPPVPIVKAVKIEPAREEIYIEASGEVVPAREVVIMTEVEGKIITLNSDMVPGGILSGGELVAAIDPAEYELRVKEQKAELDKAVSRLDIEKGQQVIAQQEWSVFEKEHGADDTDKSLALRDPQMKSAEAELESARSRLASAELALEKTAIKAPFNAVVLEEYVEKGQYVGKQSRIALLAGTDQFWVQAAVPPGYLGKISFPEKGKAGSKVRVKLERAGGDNVVRTGTVHKLLGSLDPKGRMARILVRIDDPLNLKGKEGVGRMLLGSFVKIEIEAGGLDNVYSIPREALADGDRLLILKADNTLDIRDTDVKWRREKDLLVRADMMEGDRLIVSRMQNALPGMKLRMAEEDEVREMKDVTRTGEEGKKP